MSFFLSLNTTSKKSWKYEATKEGSLQKGSQLIGAIALVLVHFMYPIDIISWNMHSSAASDIHLITKKMKKKKTRCFVRDRDFCWYCKNNIYTLIRENEKSPQYFSPLRIQGFFGLAESRRSLNTMNSSVWLAPCSVWPDSIYFLFSKSFFNDKIKDQFLFTSFHVSYHWINLHPIFHKHCPHVLFHPTDTGATSSLEPRVTYTRSNIKSTNQRGWKTWLHAGVIVPPRLSCMYLLKFFMRYVSL